MRSLVLTLDLDEPTRGRFDELRRRHFPPERLHVGAHLTVFHALPGACESAVREVIGAALPPAFDVPVTGVRFLGRGVAYDVDAGGATGLRARVAAVCTLTRQDAQPWRPHVTVQNKVPPERARALHAELSRGFVPWTAQAVAVSLWRYLGGPWEPVVRWELPSRQA